jgi:GH24 family phage-related lysozyme (muramidase)
MALSFAFDSRNETPETVARRRAIADMLAGRIGRAQNTGEGLGDLISGVAGGFMNYRANKGEASNTQRGNDLFNGGFNFPSFTQPPQGPQMGGGDGMGSPAPSQPPVQTKLPMGLPRPSEGSQTAQIAAMLKRPSMPEAPNAPAQQMAGGDALSVIRGFEGFRNKPYWDVNALRAGYGSDTVTLPDGRVQRVGKNTVVSREDAERDLARRVGDFQKGVIGDIGGDVWGKLGGGAQSALTSMAYNYGSLPRNVVAAAKSGNMQALAEAVRARGRDNDGVNADRRSKEAALILGGGTPQAPVQVASNDAPAAFQAAASQAQPVPQPMQGNIQPAAANGFDPRWATEVIASPYTSKEQKSAAQMMLEQFMTQQDPLRQLQMEKGQIEINNLKNPKPEYDFINGKDGSVFLGNKTDGSMKTLYGAQPDTVKPTADIQEYEYAKGQGFNGSFQDFQLAVKKAGASQVNIDQKAEGAFDKKLAEGQAETFNTMATEGMNARADIGLINQLEGLIQGQGGMGTGLAVAAGKWGIPVTDGMSDLQAADTIISKLVPTQRQPGSGSMSDRDVELFKSSLPSLWNQPGGNAIITKTMRGLAQYKQQQGEIAQAVQMGEMSRQDATKALKALPNPLADFGKQKPDQDGWKDMGGGVKIRKKQ